MHGKSERERRGGRRGFAGSRACCNGKQSRGEEDRVALSSLMNIQFCLVRPLAGSAGVVIPAAGPVTIIAITRGNRAAHLTRSPASQFSPVSLYLRDITRNTIEQVEPIGTIARCVCLFPLWSLTRFALVLFHYIQRLFIYVIYFRYIVHRISCRNECRSYNFDKCN